MAYAYFMLCAFEATWFAVSAPGALRIGSRPQVRQRWRETPVSKRDSRPHERLAYGCGARCMLLTLKGSCPTAGRAGTAVWAGPRRYPPRRRDKRSADE